MRVACDAAAMISEIDIWRAANLLIEEYGAGATSETMRRTGVASAGADQAREVSPHANKPAADRKPSSRSNTFDPLSPPAS